MNIDLDKRLQEIYRQCDVSNNGTENPLGEDAAIAAIHRTYKIALAEAEIKGIMYCYTMGGVTPEQQEHMEKRLNELRLNND